MWKFVSLACTPEFSKSLAETDSEISGGAATWMTRARARTRKGGDKGADGKGEKGKGGGAKGGDKGDKGGKGGIKGGDKGGDKGSRIHPYYN